MSVYALVAAAFLAIVPGLVVLVRGPGRADRVVALDLLFACALALCIAAALASGRKEFLDVGIGVALIGFLTTVGWARLVELAPPAPDAGRVLSAPLATIVSAVSASTVPAVFAVPAVLSTLFLLAGSLSLVLAALGVLRFPDALRRQHAAGKASTTAMLLIAAGAALVARDAAWTGRLVAIVVLLNLTLPLASTYLARAAIAESRDPRATDAPLLE